ncbi:periplasmic heavy metal sensor [Janthinobacterium sp.]|uniref:Spy/CpxP family protein refolding chaperone n=1 Tax=Janthinobacterium sp. TaxID=1871054 RepID=UPI00259048DC|nr:periplasmic heavy metal sensor [Janthinobacterium sp.]MCX7290482.1 periplasmic heavy metal sensor [Janthinobacterium sp.]
MKYLSIAVSLLLLSACSMPLVALAQQTPAPDGPPPRAMDGPPPVFGHGPGGPGPQGLPPFLRGIELSEAQQDKVFAATYAQAPLLREQEKIAYKAHAQLRELAASGAYDDAKASALASRAAQAMAAISLQQARLEQQLLAVLTPEQRKQAQQRRDSRPGPRHPQ